MSFDPSRFPVPIRSDLTGALRKSWADIAAPGTWWTGHERVAIAAAARHERSQRGQAPWQREALTAPGQLPEAALQAARRIAADAQSLDRDWTEQMTGELGDAPYVEIASIVVTVSAADAFCEAMGVAHEPLPDPGPGEPSRLRPEGMGDIGAWVEAQVEGWQGPNVARAMSLVPAGVSTFFRMVTAMYAGDDFGQMVWADRPLPRPAVELLAARVSAVNECFY